MKLFGWVRIRTPVLPWPWVFVAGTLQVLWVVLRWLAVHRYAAAGVAAVTLGLWWLIVTGRWPWLLAALGCACLLLGWLMRTRPHWWRHVEETLASWQRRRWYEERWELALAGAKLIGVDEIPTLISHRFGSAPGERDLDVLTVRMAAGQLPSDWRQQALRLAGTWELQRLRVHPIPGQPRDVQLFGRRYGLAPETQARWAERARELPAAQSSPQSADDGLAEPDVSPPPADTTPRRPGAFPRTPRSTP